MVEYLAKVEIVMSQPIKIAIVGRPNVGKSALFNALCGQRLSIVDEAEGVTRDRIYSIQSWKGFLLELIDTGGIDPRSKVGYQEQIRRQAETAIEEADVIVLVVDGSVGVEPLDREIAQLLHKRGKTLVCAVNKIDSTHQDPLVTEFLKLGITQLVGVSALHRRNLDALILAAIGDRPRPDSIERDRQPRITIVGKPNVGKSTLTNLLCGEERCLVAEEVGTTRDAIDVPIEVAGNRYILVDTAGVRRKGSEREVVDKFASLRTEAAIASSDLCLLMLDARTGISAQEKRLAQQIEDQGKTCVVLLNKWDLVSGFRMEHCLQSIRQEASFLKHCPILCISALDGRNIQMMWHEIGRVLEASRHRITTGQLNRFLEKALLKRSPPMIQGKRLKVYYLTQVGIEPPRFVLFVNHPRYMADSYRKYLVNQLRGAFGFPGCPLFFSLRRRGESSGSKADAATAEIAEPTDVFEGES